MNKPSGYVCSAVSDSHKTVYELLSPELRLLMNAKRGQRLHSVGRLDCDTSGLLLFTNDGFFSHELTSSENNFEKVYIAKLKNLVTKSEQKKYCDLFSTGIILPPEKKAPEQKALPAKIEFLSEDECRVTVCEGRFHQIKRMFLAVNNEVINLKRIQFGKLVLPENLLPGKYDLYTEQKMKLFFDK